MALLGRLLLISLHVDYLEFLVRAGSTIAIKLECLRFLNLALFGGHLVLIDGRLLLLSSHPHSFALLRRLTVLALDIIVAVVDLALQGLGLVGGESLARVQLHRLADTGVNAALRLSVLARLGVLVLLLLIYYVGLRQPIIISSLVEVARALILFQVHLAGCSHAGEALRSAKT